MRHPAAYYRRAAHAEFRRTLARSNKRVDIRSQVEVGVLAFAKRGNAQESGGEAPYPLSHSH